MYVHTRYEQVHTSYQVRLCHASQNTTRLGPLSDLTCRLHTGSRTSPTLPAYVLPGTSELQSCEVLPLPSKLTSHEPWVTGHRSLPPVLCLHFYRVYRTLYFFFLYNHHFCSYFPDFRTPARLGDKLLRILMACPKTGLQC